MSNPQHEPTMEEILASIRKIISEDSPEAAPESANEIPAVAEASAGPQADDILELTEEAPAPAVTAAAAPQPAPEAVQETAPGPAPVSQPAPQHDPEPQHDVVFASAGPEPEPDAANVGDIFSDSTRKAMDDVFAAIPDEPEVNTDAPSRPAATQSLAPVDAATVETVFERAVRESFEPVLKKYLADNSAAIVESMKPAIREWMDEHFPALLEGAVRAEVERVVKARGTRR